MRKRFPVFSAQPRREPGLLIVFLSAKGGAGISSHRLARSHRSWELTKTVYEYLQSTGIDPPRIYPILNRAVGLEGLPNPRLKRSSACRSKRPFPTGGNFTLAKNQNQPITTKYPNDTISIVLHELALDMVRAARLIRSVDIP